MLRLVVLVFGCLLAAAAVASQWDARAAVLAVLAWTLAWALFDGWRSTRFDTWLRSFDGTDASHRPMGGTWGEVQYRVAQRLRKAHLLQHDERQRLEHFLQAIQASPNGVALIDDKDSIEWCNEQLALHLGLDRQRDRAQRITYLVRHPEFVRYLATAQFAEPLLLENSTGAGSAPRMVVLQLFAFGEGNKLLITRDVTQEQRADTMRRDFVANVSHELKTPLTVLKGFLETLQELPLDAAEQARYVQLMVEQSSRMEQLVSDLLTLAKLDGAPQSAESDDIDMAQIVALLAAEAASLSHGQHRVVTQVADGANCAPRTVRGSRSELHSAFSNLVSNAVRYTPAGGAINISWGMRNGAASLGVADNGIGIAAEHLPRLTERFYRVDRARSRENGGTGLGLAIVKHALSRNNAVLQIESVEGRGSTFYAVFDASQTL
jgi:two-component system, OmpR family, phosphate regulon sensor histidine kinase PhoR